MSVPVETTGELFVRAGRTDAPALVADGRSYDYDWLFTTVWKAGNFLRHAGVREGVSVGVAGEGPIAFVSAFGATLLSGTVRFDPPRELSEGFRAVVAPAESVGAYELPQGGQRVGYGGDVEDPAVHDLDAGLWSENPSFPPVEIDPRTPMLSDGTRSYGHGELFEAAREVVSSYGIEAGLRVCPAGLADPRSFAAGVLAPLLAGGTVALSGEAELAVAPRDAKVDGRRIPLEEVPLGVPAES